MVQTKTAGVQGRRRCWLHRMRCQKTASTTLFLRSGAINSTTLLGPTRRDPPKVDTFCGSEDARDPTVSDKSRQKRQRQIPLITGTCPEAALLLSQPTLVGGMNLDCSVFSSHSYSQNITRT